MTILAKKPVWKQISFKTGLAKNVYIVKSKTQDFYAIVNQCYQILDKQACIPDKTQVRDVDLVVRLNQWFNKMKTTKTVCLSLSMLVLTMSAYSATVSSLF